VWKNAYDDALATTTTRVAATTMTTPTKNI
jgi:hypothetical protein